VPAGRLYKDGDILVDSGDRGVPERRKLSFAGIVSVALAVDARGEIVGDPAIQQMGLPAKTRSGELIADLIDDTVVQVLDSLPRAKRRDPDAVEQAVDRAVRGALRNVWGKKPACHVLVVEV
jgi:ribonuclease J